MHKPESVQEKKAQKFISDFETQMDHFIPARRPDISHPVDFAILVDSIKNERKLKARQILGPS